MIIFSSDPVQIEMPSDFTIALIGAVDSEGKPIDISTMPFYFEFCTTLSPQKYICSFDGKERINNKIVNNTIHLIFEKYIWKTSSKLIYRQLDRFPDPDFSDGTKDVWSSGETNIYLQQWNA